MSSTTTYKCPNCDAGLIFDAAKQKFACEFCLSTFDEGELDATASAEKERKRAEEASAFSDELREYHCSSCGAQVVMDKSTVADFCYYCHNPVVMTDRVSGVMRPDKIIPFKFDKTEAKNIFLRYARKKWFAPNDYFDPERSDKIAGVYYPFWVTDADTHAMLETSARRVRSWRSGDYRYTETSHFRINRSGNIHFEDITTSAISEEDKKMLEGILPYPADGHIDFDMPYLQGFTAKKRDIDRDALSTEVRGRMDGYASSLLRDTVRGYTSVDYGEIDQAVLGSHWEYTLMPIWILTYQRKGKNYTYAMNGSTGKIYGELPVSPIKLGILGTLAAALVGALSFLIGWGLFL